MNEAQKYLIENGISDIVINSDVFPDNTPENADNWVYLSDVLEQYEKHRKGQSLPIDSVSNCPKCGISQKEKLKCLTCREDGYCF